MKHVIRFSIFALLVAMIGCASVPQLPAVDFSICQPRSDAVPFLQEFAWPDEPMDLSACAAAVEDPQLVQITQLGWRWGSRDRRMMFLCGEGDRLCLPGHAWTVFAVADDTLYLAEFRPSSSGGAVFAYDLSTGQRLWHQGLYGLLGIDHSYYSTRLQLTVSDSLVIVQGREMGGDYVECLDRETGAIVGHRIFTHHCPEQLERWRAIDFYPSTTSGPTDQM